MDHRLDNIQMQVNQLRKYVDSQDAKGDRLTETYFDILIRQSWETE